MAQQRPLFLRHDILQRLFNLCRIPLARQTEALRQTRDMSIDDHAMVCVEGVAENDIGGFASHAAELNEGFHCGWDFSGVSLDERARSRSKKHDAAVLRMAARKNGGKSTSASFAVAGKLPHSATLRRSVT